MRREEAGADAATTETDGQRERERERDREKKIDKGRETQWERSVAL